MYVYWQTVGNYEIVCIYTSAVDVYVSAVKPDPDRSAIVHYYHRGAHQVDST